MHVATYDSAQAFVEVAEPFLLLHEVHNSLLLGNALRRIHGLPSVDGAVTYAAVFEGDQPVGAASHQPPFPVILSAGMSPQAIATLAKHMLATGWPLTGITGPESQTAAFAAVWHTLTGEQASIKQRQGVYALYAVRTRGTASGQLRPAGPDDLPLVAAWSQGFHDEATPDQPGFDAQEFARRRVADGSVYLWEDGGRVVSMAARARPTRHGITVNLVYTPPELRGRGYATACVAALSQQLLDAGYTFCTLFTDLGNPTSNHIYQQIGYERICDFVIYQFA
ncbi:MAG: GNAT family N-acetyltransferase [Anaerolineae bacterium]